MSEILSVQIPVSRSLEVSQNVQAINQAAVVGRMTNLEEHVKNLNEQQYRTVNVEQSQQPIIEDGKRGGSTPYQGGTYSRNPKKSKKEVEVIDEFRGHVIDVRT